MLKRSIVTVLIMTLFLTMFTPATAKSNQYKYLIGEVIEIIDSEVLNVVLYKQDDTEYVRLIGIDSHASADAYAYVKQFINQTPLFFKIQIDDEGNFITDENNFAYAEVLDMSSVSLNEQLLARGFAVINSEHSHLNNYSSFYESYLYAVNNGIGIHGDGTIHNPYAKKVNINTASKSEISMLLDDTDLSLGIKIASYVSHNKINTLDELKFIDPAITNEWIDKNKESITLVTNITTAEEYELESLFGSGVDEKIAEAIIDFRLEDVFTDIIQLNDIEGVYDSMYIAAEPFISLQYVREYKDEDTDVVNINTASLEQIDDLEGMSKSDAEIIVKYRKDDLYSYKSEEELLKIPNALRTAIFNKHEDSFVTSTDINTAYDYELKSLFGRNELSSTQIDYYVDKIKQNRPFNTKVELKNLVSTEVYNTIKPFIYVDEPDNKTRININLATKEQLMDLLDLTSEEAEDIVNYTNIAINYYGKIHLKVDLSEKDDFITLYTNINSAGVEELMLLHEDMTRTLANDIIEYRDISPFAHLTELESYFRDINQYNIYKEICDFIVFR